MKNINIRMTEEEHKKLRIYAAENGKNVSQVIREILFEYSKIKGLVK